MIYCESCFDRFTKMADKEVDYVFTSPPYNRKRNDKYAYFNDSNEDYYTMLHTVISESMRVSRKYVFINVMKNYYNSSDIYRIIGEFHDKIAEVFVWEKSNPLPASGLSITNAFEYILVFGEKGLKSKRTYTKNHLTTSVAKMPKEHKAVMHKEVSDFFVKNFMGVGEVCYDPFMGTGTTAISCIENDVEYIGSEIVSEYVALAEKRIQSKEKWLSIAKGLGRR